VVWRTERQRNGGVDEIPLVGLAGRLWLCGKHFVGPDPEAALAQVGATTLVTLTEAHELLPRYPDLVAWLESNAGDRAIWFPVPDLHAPPLDALRPVLVDLHARLAAGEGLLVHCGAGIGRAGTLAAALLVTLGSSPADALDLVAASRPGAGPQSAEQDALVHRLAAG